MRKEGRMSASKRRRVVGRGTAGRIALTLAVLAISGTLARAGFSDASRAFDAGDYPAAAAIWHELAGRCDAKAQTALAGLYHAGLGVKQSDLQALRWYLMAAWAGDRYAQQVAGEWYANGDVVPADPVRAAFWFTLAAERGLAWSADRRDAVLVTLGAVERDALDGRLASYEAIASGMCGAGR
jgi:hypothetical protein